MKRDGIRLYWLILTLLLPLVLLAAGMVSREMQHRFAANIIASFDAKLVGMVSLVGTFLDGDAHRQLYAAREIEQLAVEPESGTLYGWEARTGRLARVYPNGASTFVVDLPRLEVRDLVFSDPARALLLVEAPAGLYRFDLARAEGAFFPFSGAANYEQLLIGPEGVVLLRQGSDFWRWEAGADPEPVVLPFLEEVKADVFWSKERQQWLVATGADGGWQWMDRNGGGATALDVPLNDMSGDVVLAGHRLWVAGPSLGVVDLRSGATNFAPEIRRFFPARSPAYARAVETFKRIRHDAGLTYLYTQMLIDDTALFYVVDGSEVDEFSPIGTMDTLPAASFLPLKTAELAREPVVRPIEEWENWGLLKSGFGPVLMRNGGSEGMIGADLKVDIIEPHTRQAAFASILTAVLGITLALTFTVIASRQVTRPLEQLKGYLVRMAGGEWSAALPSLRVTEVAAVGQACQQLARSFEAEQRAQEAQFTANVSRLQRRHLIRQLFKDVEERVLIENPRVVVSTASRALGLGHLQAGAWHALWILPRPADHDDASTVALARRLAQWRVVFSRSAGADLNTLKELDHSLSWGSDVSLFLWQEGADAIAYRLADSIHWVPRPENEGGDQAGGVRLQHAASAESASVVAQAWAVHPLPTSGLHILVV